MQETKTAEERKRLLAQQVQTAVGRGGRIDSQSDEMAIVIYGKPVNHVLHFFIGLFTLGLWWIVWAIMAITGGEKREMITIDEYGGVLVQKV